MSVDHLGIIDFSHIENIEEQDDIAALEKVFKGESVEEPLVFMVPEGFVLPVHFELNTPLAHMDSRCSELIFSRNIFLYVDAGSMLVSPDKEQWAAIGDLDSVKKLFGGGDGELSISMRVSKESGPLLEIVTTVYTED